MSDTSHEELTRLNVEIEKAEKRAMVLSMTGRFTAGEGDAVDALYQKRHAWLNERDIERRTRRNGGVEDERERR